MNTFLKNIILVTIFLGLLSSCGGGDSLPPSTTAPEPAPDTTIPALVGVVSTTNTRIFVSFSKPMGISAVEISNYVITQENVNPEVGTLIINAAYFPPGDTAQTSVVLETLPQNEVTYRLQTSGIKDADGNSIPGIISTLGGIVNTGSVTFAGSAPTLIDLVVTADTTGAITGWVDVNGNSLLDAGDTLKNNSGNNIILTDFDGDGVIDNWVDTDTSVTVTDGDVI